MFPGQYIEGFVVLLCEFVDVEALCGEGILPYREVETFVPEVELCTVLECSLYCWCDSPVGSCDDSFEAGAVDGVKLEL